MNMLFHKMRTGKKGQIVAVLTAVLIIFLIIAFTVVNLGKTKIQKEKVKNGAQAAVLAGGSSACVLLNSMANVNDQMVLNFVGFTLMIQFLLLSWTIDYIKVAATAFDTLIPFNWMALTDTINGVMTLCLTTATIALMIAGATSVGKSIKKYIDELNDKLPKNSRDSARQYAFSNAGVDEPKIPFSKSGCADAWCYSLLETGFDVFMRTLPGKNKTDFNYGTSTIEYKWNDSRTEHIVENKVAVTVTPVQKVCYQLIYFEDVGKYSGEINAYLSTQELGVLSFLIEWGVSIADTILLFIKATVVLIEMLAAELTVIAVFNAIWAASYATTCYGSCTYCSCCPSCALMAYYIAAAAAVAIAATLADVAAWAFFFIYNNNPPEKIPCFVWDRNNTLNEYPLSAAVARTTDPSSIDYKIYKTDWPSQSHSANGIVKDGSIFPPNQNFDIIPNF